MELEILQKEHSMDKQPRMSFQVFMLLRVYTISRRNGRNLKKNSFGDTYHCDSVSIEERKVGESSGT